MSQCIHRTISTARRKYYDDCADHIEQFIANGLYEGLPFSELRILAKFRMDRDWAYNIYPGQKYERQFNIQDGEPFVFRMKIEFKAFCKYDLFVE